MQNATEISTKTGDEESAMFHPFVENVNLLTCCQPAFADLILISPGDLLRDSMLNYLFFGTK